LLIDKGIFASTIPKEYGGIEHGQKDMLQIAESMGNVDLSTFNTFNQILMISKLISQFGSEEQKQRYLAGIAIGKWRPAICWQEDT
jgi:butyryl-CoA dehydrogenase